MKTGTAEKSSKALSRNLIFEKFNIHQTNFNEATLVSGKVRGRVFKNAKIMLNLKFFRKIVLK